jgi:4-hydroxy-tetrahydrodipicolinate synthase
LPAGELRKPLKTMDADGLKKGLRIVKELELDKKYGWSSPALKTA